MENLQKCYSQDTIRQLIPLLYNNLLSKFTSLADSKIDL